MILSAISNLRSAGFLGLAISIAIGVGAVMPMDHWPTRYFRPISIRNSEGALPY
jgi:hypothetical protein